MAFCVVHVCVCLRVCVCAVGGESCGMYVEWARKAALNTVLQNPLRRNKLSLPGGNLLGDNLDMATVCTRWLGNVIGIGTRYWLDGPGSNPGGGEIFHTWCPRSLLTMGTGSFSSVKSGRGLTLTPHPLLLPWSRKCRSIPLLSLCAIRPLQSLSACTRVHFTFTVCTRGPGSVVGIATGYGLDGPGIECWWGRDFPHLSRPALVPTQPPHNGYRVFPRSKERPGRNADPSPPFSAMLKEE